MNEYKLTTDSITKKMQKEAQHLVEWVKSDYDDNNEKVGKPKVTYEFESYVERPMIKTVLENGNIRYTSSDEKGGEFYELVLKIKFPLTYLPFKAVDVHTYRWNDKHQEYEFESMEIL